MIQAIETLKKETFFSKKQGAKKVFQRGVYCRINKAYECTNTEDISDFIYLKKGVKVYSLETY